MFKSQKSTGSGYTTTVAYLAGAIFSPLIVLISLPVGYISICLAIACSVLFVALAWVNFRMSSQSPTPSIKPPRAVAE